MLISEKVAYLNGLLDGLTIDENSKEGKIFTGILDVLSEIAFAIEDIECDMEEFSESLEDTFDDIDEIYSELDGEPLYADEDFEDEDFDDEEEDSHEGCGCGCSDHSHEESELLYEVVCPTCNEEIFFDDDMLEKGSMNCHACGEDLEFDTSALDEEE